MKGIWIRYYVQQYDPVLDYREFRDSEELIAWIRSNKRLGQTITIVDIGDETDVP